LNNPPGQPGSRRVAALRGTPERKRIMSKRKYAPGFRTKSYPTMNGDGIIAAMPTKFLVPLVRPGMPVRLCDQRSDTGIVLYCLREACVVRGSRGEICSIAYSEVDLIGCQPDPDAIVPDDQEWAPEQEASPVPTVAARLHRSRLSFGNRIAS
jgi:hypothetical protein